MNRQRPPALVVGIGSPHGDDQAGWKVIDRLESIVGRDVELVRAKVPHQLLDSIQAAKVLHLVDACDQQEPAAVVQRYRIEGDQIDRETGLAASAGEQQAAVLSGLRSDCTHHVDIVSVLCLARQLDSLPEEVILWMIPGRSFQFGDDLDETCQGHVRRCAEMIAEELAGA